MRPLPTTTPAAISTGTDATNSPQTPTPSRRVEVSSETPVILSPLSRSLLDKPKTNDSETTGKVASTKVVGAEAEGGALPWCGVGAKVHPKMYADMERVAAFQNIGLSDVIREGVALYLQASGIDQGFRIEAEVLEAAQARLREHEANAQAILPKVPIGVAARRLQEPPYRHEKLREAARLHPEAVATAVRMWAKPYTRKVIGDAAVNELLVPKTGHPASVGPKILQVLHSAFGSYAALGEALAQETGVPA